MKKGGKIAIWSISLLALGGLAYYLYKRATKKILGRPNFDLLVKNMPNATLGKDKSGNDTLYGKIDDRYDFLFFVNNRFFIKDKQDKGLAVAYGFYYNGGKWLQSDDKSKNVKGKNVLENLTEFRIL